MQLVNNRLSESPVQQEFKHFVQPLYAINEDAKASTAHQRIKMAANWRCIEYENLLSEEAWGIDLHARRDARSMAWRCGLSPLDSARHGCVLAERGI